MQTSATFSQRLQSRVGPIFAKLLTTIVCLGINRTFRRFPRLLDLHPSGSDQVGAVAGSAKWLSLACLSSLALLNTNISARIHFSLPGYFFLLSPAKFQRMIIQVNQNHAELNILVRWVRPQGLLTK